MGRGPKSSAGALRRPYEHMTETDTHREGCVRMEAEIGGKATPRTADLRKPGSKDGFFSGPLKGAQPCRGLGFRLLDSRTMRESLSAAAQFVAIRHSGPGILTQLLLAATNPKTSGP